ncbi:hypothetical protein GGR20_001393 [Devosia subaequoris]|uniref:PRC-barrel domain-containing protein n=1 Tax=Devosia subaequoris TaxID=395930 RepID=A0A7W6ILC2_9HYPH|nr:PRC-barrel domain-containing protein [Devosia subaequoris]MBB4051751.1 hypothetical protein [Devosia subaequoris]MCP1210910.1 PRC-barrel domain-containing protein [Devosia subaequoris]
MKLFTTAALAAVTLLGGAPALAQFSGDWNELIRTRDLTGSPVYTTNEAHDEGSWGAADGDYMWGWSGYEGVDDNWNHIGEIEDVVLTKSGDLRGVVVEVGGFLDIGDKHVFLQVEDVELTPEGDEDYVLVTRYSEEELESMEGVNEAWWE